VSAPVAVHRLRGDACVVAGNGVAAARRHGGGDRVRAAAKATSRAGFRRIATDLARPTETVRGWLRRFAERAEAVRSVFTVWLRGIDPDPVMPDAAGGGFADAVTVIGALAAAIGRRFVLPGVSLAEAAVAVSGGRLLAPGWPGEWVQHESTLPAAPIAP
jgi:uncharacterized membrane protein YkvA (DUF1232 family)